MNTSAPTSRGVSRIRLPLLCALALAFTAATVHAQGSGVRVETFSLKPGGEVVVENSRGSTRVESWDSQTVRVLAEKKGAAGGAIQPGELVLMGAQNSILVECKPGMGRLDLTLYVPSNAQLQVTGGAWPVDVAGTLAGAAVDTTSGNIGYRLPSNDDAQVTMRSLNGVVSSSLPLIAAERNGPRSMRGQIGNGASRIVLNSQSGGVMLTPGPASSAVARASNKDTGSRARDDVSRVPVIDKESQDARQRSADRDPIQQRGSMTTAGGAAGRGTQSGSIDLGGADRSDDSMRTSKSGPFVRPRQERNTSSGGSGLKVRIIPSNAPPRSSRDNGGSVFDQARDEEDANHTGQPSPSSSSSVGAAGPTGPNSSSNGSVVFAGNDRSNDNANSARVGPLERNRQQRDTSGGNSGLRVRIIPADAPPGRERRSSAVFDNRDTSQDQSAPDDIPARSTQRQDQTGRSDSYASRRAIPMPIDSDDQSASNKTRSGPPPVLGRSRADEPSSAAEAEPRATGDEEAVVLKAALVNLNVSVTNRAGVALANLKKEDFDIAENGDAQKIEFFQSTNAPFNLVLALDLSGSIKDKLDVIKSAALKFIDVVGPQDKVAVVTFTDEIRVVSQLTGDRDELRRRIKLIDKSQGGTAFYEALWFALVDTLRGTRGQRNAIVVMTDGVDSSLDRYSPMDSRVSFNQLAHRLEEADVIVFPIYLDTEYEEVFERGNSSSEAYAIARDQLERISAVSGGQLFKAEKASDLAGVYKQVAAALRTVYSVGYYPTNAERDGTFRRVRIVVNRPDAAVRTRRGYYAR